MRTPTPSVAAFVLFICPAACGGSADPRPAADASVSAADAGSAVATICANLRRLGCGGGSRCDRELEAIFNAVPARCSAQRDAYFACAARTTVTGCLSRDATYLQCAALNEALARCACPAHAGGPAEKPEPPDPPMPFDAGRAACPEVSGRFEGTGGGSLTVCPSGTFTLARSAAGDAPCRYSVSFVNGAMGTFSLSAARFDVAADLSITGEATVTDRDGTRAGGFSGAFLEVGAGAVALVRLSRGTDECSWHLVRSP